ncbi:protein Niban 1a [Lepisosteus oculatus]|uniref:protein Niban 1a n=1 Tax=Lepisosteus oculatus TaxID=7918 RepID=UPI00371EE3D1
MGGSSSSLLDESKCNYIRGRAEAELKNFSPHYKRQYAIAFFSEIHDEVEQHKPVQTQLLKQRDALEPGKVLYEENILHYSDEVKKWKERFVVVRGNYSLECHDSYETFVKGVEPRLRLLPTGGTVVTSLDKYNTLVDRSFPDPNSMSEEASPPLVTMPDQFPVYLHLPYRKDWYFCFHSEDVQKHFISILEDCIRHQNQDFLKKTTCDVQAFLKAVQFYRQEKNHYESWDMLIGSDAKVLSNLVMEDLLPSLQTELVPRLKGKKNERKRVWFATVESAYTLVQEQVAEGLNALKEECKETAKQQEARIRSDMDQIVNSKNFLAGKLKATVSEPTVKCCLESVQPYLASILEELMVPISSGFQDVRVLVENEIDQLGKDYQESNSTEELKQALGSLGQVKMRDCYQQVEVLREQLKELRNRFKYSNTTRLVHSTQSYMQQLMDNVVYTFEMLLFTALKDNPANVPSAIEKAKQRVLKQYDYDSSTIRKKIFQEALVEITLPTIRKTLAPSCKPELQKFDQYIFADYANFVQVENVYEEILLEVLEREVSKVVKEAASAKKHNLFVDSMDLPCVSQSSLTDSKTPPGSTPASPAKQATAKETPAPQPQGNGIHECLDQPDTSSVSVAEKKENGSTIRMQTDTAVPSLDTGSKESFANSVAALSLNPAKEESPANFTPSPSQDTAGKQPVADSTGLLTIGTDHAVKERDEKAEEKSGEETVLAETQAPDSLHEIRNLMAGQGELVEEE